MYRCWVTRFAKEICTDERWMILIAVASDVSRGGSTSVITPGRG